MHASCGSIKRAATWVLCSGYLRTRHRIVAPPLAVRDGVRVLALWFDWGVRLRLGVDAVRLGLGL